jgi:type IV pilus biogenesis protein CpaD/CtpE
MVGKSHPNPVLDTRVLEVQFPDGNVQEFAANIIAKHIYLQVDDEGCRGYQTYCRNAIVLF